MILSDVSVTRPVFASVLSLLLIAFGAVSFTRLPLREYPDIDPPVVSVDTNYPGAAANVVETRITEVIEDRISGVEGIKFISSTSSDGRSQINIEFDVARDIEAAANDVRDRVSGIADDLPEEADPPDIQKADSSDDVVIWLNLVSDQMSVLELTDYARRYLQDRFSVLPGVARVRIGGGLEYAMRVWLDRNKLAARGLTVQDIEDALRAENVELPAGSIESEEVQFTARIERAYQTPEDFQKLVVAKTDNYLVRLGDVARVEKSAIENRTFFRGNGVPMVGIGVIKQSKGNTIEVAQAAIDLAKRLEPNLPMGMKIFSSYDTSVFIRGAIAEVYKTLAIAIILVVGVIYLFLGSWRAMVVPAVTVPVSLVATFTVLYAFGFSINLLTLLALVLAIGLVVDDAVVVLENIYRRIEDGEPPLSAAYFGTRQVSFAVIATTVVLVAVFAPITFLEGDLGRLFSEFAITMAAAVSFSTFVAVTLCPMIASKLLTKAEKGKFHQRVDNTFERFSSTYGRALELALKFRKFVIVSFVAIAGLSLLLLNVLPSEYAPKEDRGAFFLSVKGPEGASYNYTKEYMEEIEKRLMPYVKSGEIDRLLVRAPRSFGTLASFNDGIVINVLADWSKRRPASVIMSEISGKMSDLPGVRAFPIMRQGFGRGIQKPVQFVLGGGTYEELAEWRNILIEKINENNPGLTDVDSDYDETKPQLKVLTNKNRAGDLGVNGQIIGRTLETMLGSRRVTTYIDDGEEYDVILEGERDTQRTPTNMSNIYVRANSGKLIPLSNMVAIEEYAGSSEFNRYNRVRAITIEAGLADGYSLGEALEYLRSLTREHLPTTAVIDYKGQSLDYQSSGSSLLFVFMLGFIVVFLVLAAQFESYIHPLVIVLTVPLAMTGALVGLTVTGNSLNVYTQIGLIMLIGLAAKNGILIVEFVNQLRDEGIEFSQALMQAAQIRLRPIVMTGITTVVGSVPLILSTGAGSETRMAIGVVILFGVAAATVFTLFVVPVAYDLLARKTGSPGDVRRVLESQQGNLPTNEQHENSSNPRPLGSLTFTGLLALLLTGCSVGPNYVAPSTSVPDTWFSEKSEAISSQPINIEWWNVFKDPLLEKYVQIAVNNNKDLKISLANIRSARASRKEQSSAFWPELGGSASADRSKSSGAVSSFNSGQIRNTFDATFDASWEIDIFGGNRRSNEAAEARIGVSLAEYQDVMLSTLSEVARTYYETRGLQKRIAITEQNTQLLKETFDVVQARLTAGETSDFDLSRAQGEYQLTRARIPNLRAELRASIFRLSVLLGTPPETLLNEMERVEALPTPPDIVPVGLRSEILRRRPDIRIAERELAASIADIGVQVAELFPHFFLTGDIGSQARLFGDVFSSGSGIWTLASMVQWSVFEGGAIRARIELREAQSNAALAEYEKSVLEALRDTETALSRYGKELETRKLLAQGVESRRKSVYLAKELFNAGEQDYLAVVDAERQLIDSEDDLVVSETNSITKLIALYSALGGGWEVFDSQTKMQN